MNFPVILAGVAVVVLGAGCAVDRTIHPVVRLFAILTLAAVFLTAVVYPILLMAGR